MTVAHRRAELPLLAAATAVVAWGFGPLFVRGIDADSTTIVMWRILLALPIATMVAYATGGRLSWRMIWQAVPTGACFALSVVAAFTSFQETSIVNATLIPALQPALVLIIAARLFGERRTRVEIALAVVAFGGVALVVLGASSGSASLYGNLLAVANLLMFAGYFLLAKRARAGDVHSWAYLAAVFYVAACIVVPWAMLVNGGVETVHGTDWLLLVGLVLLPGMVGHGFMTWAHHYVDVSVTSMLTLANPVVSIVGAWVLFSQALSGVQVVGAATVLAALGIIVRHQSGVRALESEAAIGQDLLDAPPGLPSPDSAP